MIEIGVADPLRVTEGKPTRCSGEMDVDISFEVSAKSMNGKKDTREKALLRAQSLMIFAAMGE